MGDSPRCNRQLHEDVRGVAYEAEQAQHHGQSGQLHQEGGESRHGSIQQEKYFSSKSEVSLSSKKNKK